MPRHNLNYERVKGICPVPQRVTSVQELSNEIDERSSKDITQNVFLILTGRKSSEPEVGKEIIDYLQVTGKKVYKHRYLVLDESYRKIKLTILDRDTYDAKITLIKYEI
jgi:hypothetical protein